MEQKLNCLFRSKQEAYEVLFKVNYIILEGRQAFSIYIKVVSLN